MSRSSLNRLGKRIQARQGSHWVQNTPENTLGISIPVCPHCGALNPYDVGDPAPLRCHREDCRRPLVPDCPEHGEAACAVSCKARPCPACQQGPAVPVPAFIDPAKFRAGQICRTCGRETP